MRVWSAFWQWIWEHLYVSLAVTVVLTVVCILTGWTSEGPSSRCARGRSS